jgi:GNAT superfamily N-acetyltransferase
MNGVAVRRAGWEDGETLLDLIRDPGPALSDAKACVVQSAPTRRFATLAEYERLEPPDHAARERLLEHGFGERPRFETYLAEIDGGAVGYAIVFETYSTFLARPTLHLEDLFVRPEARRQVAGGALLRHLAAEAVRRGCGRMEWSVLDWNELAQGLYRRAGASQLAEWRLCRLTGEALERFARGGE